MFDYKVMASIQYHNGNFVFLPPTQAWSSVRAPFNLLERPKAVQFISGKRRK